MGGPFPAPEDDVDCTAHVEGNTATVKLEGRFVRGPGGFPAATCPCWRWRACGRCAWNSPGRPASTPTPSEPAAAAGCTEAKGQQVILEGPTRRCGISGSRELRKALRDRVATRQIGVELPLLHQEAAKVLRHPNFPFRRSFDQLPDRSERCAAPRRWSGRDDLLDEILILVHHHVGFVGRSEEVVAHAQGVW